MWQWLFGASLIVMGITVLSNADAGVEATKSQIKQE
jgi:hypothetical protein